MLPLTLKRAGNILASPKQQLQLLSDPAAIPTADFSAKLSEVGTGSLRSVALLTLQVNVGKLCNQTCTHCHVDAGPDRRESMTRQTAEQVIDFLRRSSVETIDITGGAPEMNPNFRWLVEQATAANRETIVRSNLTILIAPGFDDLPQFLADHRVTIVASLPCYLEENCDAQRGSGAFDKSIKALRRLNQLGYGLADTGLELNLVYNPVGTSLPPDQSTLEEAYRTQLRARYNVEFNKLFTITNMPISRYLDDLIRSGQFQTYMEKLTSSFNPSTIDNLMCRTMVSVDWNGFLYDCDFNQMLELHLDSTSPRHISEVNDHELVDRMIQTANHCFGCTAGCGSSCQGSLT